VAFVIMTGLGTLGETTPYVAVGAELRRRGHEVALVSNPVFERQANEAGLTHVPLGTLDEYREFARDPELWERDTVIKAAVKYSLRHAQRLYETIVRIHRPGESVLFTGPTNYPARLAQEKLGIPFVAGVVSPFRMASRFDPCHPGRPFPAWTNALVRSRLGLRLIQRLRRSAHGKGSLPPSMRAARDEIRRLRALAGLPEQSARPDALRAGLMICLWPSWLSPPQKDWPRGARTAGFPFYPALPQRPARPSPPGGRASTIVFTRGSAVSHERSFFSVAADCCRILGRHGTLVTPHAENVLPDLPPGVEHVAQASFPDLLARAAAIVYHGGIGTMAHALAAGTPQLVLPIVSEQFDLGYRMERLGVGRMLTRVPLNAARLAGALRSLLASDRVRGRCERLQREVDPVAGSTLAADWIEEQLETEGFRPAC
jgi:rhamnosyltransferase subunit B